MRKPKQFRQSEVDALARGLHRRQILAGLKSKGFSVTPEVGTDSYAVRDAERRGVRLSFGADGAVRTESADGRAITRWFDSEGRIARLIDAGGLDVRMGSVADGGRKVERVGHGAFVVTSDVLGLPGGIVYPDGTASQIDWWAEDGETIVDRAGHRSQRLRGADGDITGYIDSAGGINRFEESGDAADKTLVWQTAAGRRHEYGLDGLGSLASWRVDGVDIAKASGDERVQTVQYADGHWASTEKDGSGRLVAAHNPNGTVRLTYDGAGRLMAEDQAGLVVRYERDRSGLLTAIVLPSGERLGFSYDENGRLDCIRDWDGQGIQISWAPNGQIASILHPNGVSTRMASDALSQITRLATHAPGRAQPLFEASYAYDAADRLVEAVERGVQNRYAYDAVGRLTGVASSDPAFSEAWELDAMGNRVVDRGVTYSVDPDNLVSGPGRHGIAYDRLGRTRRIETPGGEALLTYNGQGHLTRLQTAAGLVADYAYDGLGRRIQKRVGGRTTHFLWAGQTLLTEWTDTPGGPWERRDHLFLPDMFLPLAMRVDGEVYHLHADRRGAPNVMTDAEGAPVWEASLKPFGTAVPRGTTARVDNPWRLPNQYRDPESGLHYNLIRYMHPGIGRYLTPDPLFDPAARGNWYIYAGGDPLGKSDPTGEVIIPAIFIAMAVGAVIGGAIAAYQSRNEDLTAGQRAVAIGKGALFGGVVGGVGFLAGHVVLGALGLGATTGAGIATLMGVGALEGAVSSVAESCAEAALYDEMVSAQGLAADAVLGALLGAVSAGAGGLYARRLRRLKQLKELEALKKAPDYLDPDTGTYPNSPYKDKTRSPHDVAEEINETLRKKRAEEAKGRNEGIAKDNQAIKDMHDRYVETGMWDRSGLDDFSGPDAALEAKRAARVAEQAEAARLAARAAETAQRLDELKVEGHGPQRHEGDVTKEQLDKRVLTGEDPATGSNINPNSGNPYVAPRRATRIKDPETYVEAEKTIRGSQAFDDAAPVPDQHGVETKSISVPLEQAIGPDYANKLEGSTRVGSVNNPQGVRDTNFADGGEMTAIYKKDPATGEWKLLTMFPEPAND